MSAVESPEPYDPYVEDTRWAIARKFRQLSSALGDAEDIAAEISSKIQVYPDEFWNAWATVKSRLNHLVDVLQVQQYRVDIHLKNLRNPAVRLDLAGIDRRLDDLGQLLRADFSRIYIPGAYLGSGPYGLDDSLPLRDYERLRLSLFDGLLGGSVGSLVEDMRNGVSRAIVGREAVKEKRLARKVLEEEQLMKLWPVS